VSVAPGAATTEPGLPPKYALYERTFPLPAETLDRLYMSVLLRPDQLRGSYAGLEFGSIPRTVHVGAMTGYDVYGMRFSDGLVAATNTPVVQGETAFLVIEITRLPTSSETIYRLYVNPDARLWTPAFPSVQVTVWGLAPLPSSVRIKGDGGYTTDEIRIGLTWASVVDACYADCDASGSLSIADFACFQAAFVTGDPYADCNASGTFTMVDFGCFQAVFAGACP
jgi:hypothetical protein